MDHTQTDIMEFFTRSVVYSPLHLQATAWFQTCMDTELIHEDSCLTRQLAYVHVKVIYIYLSESGTMAATLP